VYHFPGFTVLAVVDLAQTVLIVKFVIRRIAREAQDPLTQAVDRNRHSRQLANHLFGIGAGVLLAFIIGNLCFTRLRFEFYLSASQWVQQQQTIAILPSLLPEEAGVDFLLIGVIGERAARLILA